MQLLIRTPESTVLEVDNVTSVTAESPDGRFGVLTGHVAMTAALKESLLTYVTEGNAKTAVVMGGLLQTDGQTVTVLTAAAENVDTLDKARVLAAKERAEKRLQHRDDTVDVTRAELALGRALVRLKALK